jgi:hypothetical protein
MENEETIELDLPEPKKAQTQPLIKKEAKKVDKPKPKFYYDVKVECMLPATLTYRVFAEDPNQASIMIKGLHPTSVKHRLIGRKEMKLAVYDAGCSMIRLVKNLFK